MTEPAAEPTEPAVDPNDFFGTTDPLIEELAVITGTPPGWPTIYAPGEGPSSAPGERLTGIRDVRVPERFQGLEKLLIGQEPHWADRIRLVRGDTCEFGQVTLWERLDHAGQVDPAGYFVASVREGDERVRLSLNFTLAGAETQYGRRVDKLNQLEEEGL